jgi:phosphatidylglycerol:prolipoprotein diacylglycerol transferase
MLRISKLSFPGLGIGEFEVNSEAFSIFGVSIAWYALIITCGMVLAVLYTIFRAKQIGLTVDDVIDMAIFAIPIGIVGARLYYVITSPESFDSFAEILNIRNGGLAIYGGIIAGALAVIGVCLYKKIKFFAFADCCTPGIILAQAIGRWGNFMNGEAFGALTDGFFRMGIDNSLSYYTFGTAEMVYVHPTFLYESLWNLLGFALVNLFYKHKKYDGQIFLCVFGWYGLGRMFIEGLRTDSLYIGPFGLLTVISMAVILIAALVCIFYIRAFMGSIKAREYKGKTQYIIYTCVALALIFAVLAIIDSALSLTPKIIPELRVSQVLALCIFTVCAISLIYLAIKRPAKDFYYKSNAKEKERI